VADQRDLEPDAERFTDIGAHPDDPVCCETRNPVRTSRLLGPFVVCEWAVREQESKGAREQESKRARAQTGDRSRRLLGAGPPSLLGPVSASQQTTARQASTVPWLVACGLWRGGEEGNEDNFSSIILFRSQQVLNALLPSLLPLCGADLAQRGPPRTRTPTPRARGPRGGAKQHE